MCARLILSTVVCVAWAGLAAGQSTDSAQEARRHFDAGTQLYAKGQLNEALAEFELANQLKPDPALLYDLAQTHRSLGHDTTALTFYRAFLDAAPYTPNREEVRSKIKLIEDELALREAERHKLETSVAAAAKRAQEAEEAKRVAKELADIAAQQVARATEAQRSAHEAQLKAEGMLKKPLYKKWWLWTIVGAVAAAGVVTAAVLATPQVPSSNQGNIAF